MLRRSTCKGHIYVVDGDAVARQTLCSSLGSAGYEVTCFADGTALLSEVRARTPACIVLEAGIADGSGLEVLKKLRRNDCPSPVVMAASNADIPTAVDAIRNGAFDFVEKPFRLEEIVARIEAAIGHQACEQPSNGVSKDQGRSADWEPLTPREREVLAHIVAGDSNKEMAQQLGLSWRTIEGYRASIMKKVGARNATDLVRRMFDRTRAS
jgi:two-component system, LuxR family, response regulator FixJ